MKYAIASTHTLGWEETRCTTERAAKRKATTELGAGYNDDTLMVAEIVRRGESKAYRVVSEKSNQPGSKWRKI